MFIQEDFHVGRATGVTAIAQPLTANVNKVVGPIQVAARGAFGRVVTVDDSTVVSITGAPGSLQGTQVRTVKDEVATFNDIRFTGTGAYILTFTSTWSTSTAMTARITT